VGGNRGIFIWRSIGFGCIRFRRIVFTVEQIFAGESREKIVYGLGWVVGGLVFKGIIFERVTENDFIGLGQQIVTEVEFAVLLQIAGRN